MAYTLQNMRDLVRTHADLDTSDLPDTVLDFFLKEAYAQVTRKVKRWPFFQGSWSYNTVAGTKDVLLSTIGSDCDSVTEIMAPNWVLREAGRDQADKLYPTLYVTSGQPTMYARWGATPSIRLYPTPDGVYALQIRGFQKADTAWFTTASGAGVPSQLPDDLHLALIEWALYRAYMQQDDPLGASQHREAYLECVTGVERDLASPIAAQPLILGRGSQTARYLPERLPYSFDY